MCFLQIQVDDAGGFIFSPGYPDNYPDNSQCLWILTVPEHFIIQVTLIMANIEENLMCLVEQLRVIIANKFLKPLIVWLIWLIYNFVQIFDGLINEEDPESNLLLSFCSDLTQPQSFTSSGSTLSISFQSDESGNDAGFSIFFERRNFSLILKHY